MGDWDPWSDPLRCRARPRLSLREFDRATNSAGVGRCASCTRSAPQGLEPQAVRLYVLGSSRVCEWCWFTWRVYLLGQRLAPDHSSWPHLRSLLTVVLDHLPRLLGPAHDGDSELDELNIIGEGPQV